MALMGAVRPPTAPKIKRKIGVGKRKQERQATHEQELNTARPTSMEVEQNFPRDATQDNRQVTLGGPPEGHKAGAKKKGKQRGPKGGLKLAQPSKLAGAAKPPRASAATAAPAPLKYLKGRPVAAAVAAPPSGGCACEADDPKAAKRARKAELRRAQKAEKRRKLRAHQVMSKGGMERIVTPTTASEHPFETEAKDHAETPFEAYRDVEPFLFQLALQRETTKKALRIYDPYFCEGSMVHNLGRLVSTMIAAAFLLHDTLTRFLVGPDSARRRRRGARMCTTKTRTSTPRSPAMRPQHTTYS